VDFGRPPAPWPRPGKAMTGSGSATVAGVAGRGLRAGMLEEGWGAPAAPGKDLRACTGPPFQRPLPFTLLFKVKDSSPIHPFKLWRNFPQPIPKTIRQQRLERRNRPQIGVAMRWRIALLVTKQPATSQPNRPQPVRPPGPEGAAYPNCASRARNRSFGTTPSSVNPARIPHRRYMSSSPFPFAATSPRASQSKNSRISP
jgi:hypothetical protein